MIHVISGNVYSASHNKKIHISQSNSQGSSATVSYTYESVFDIGKQAVVLSSKRPIIISDGDHITVSGRIKRGMLEANFYRNDTRGIEDNGPYLYLLVVSIAFISISLTILIGALNNRQPTSIIDTLCSVSLFLVPLTCGGAFCLALYLRRRAELRALRKSKPL